MNKAPLIIPNDETEIITIKEEVYKSALEIILALCINNTSSFLDIQAVCETVLRKGGNTDE